MRESKNYPFSWVSTSEVCEWKPWKKDEDTPYIYNPEMFTSLTAYCAVSHVPSWILIMECPCLVKTSAPIFSVLAHFSLDSGPVCCCAMSALQWTQGRLCILYSFVFFFTLRLGTSLFASPYISQWKHKVGWTPETRWRALVLVWRGNAVHGPFLRWSGSLGLFLGSLQWTQTSFHLVIWTIPIKWKLTVSNPCVFLCVTSYVLSHLVMPDPLWPHIPCPPGSSVLGIFQARILGWLAIPFSRGPFWPRDWTQVPCIFRWVLYHWATWEASPPPPKWLQSCLTLYDPRDGSPPGSPPSVGFSRQEHWNALPFPSPAGKPLTSCMRGSIQRSVKNAVS